MAVSLLVLGGGSFVGRALVETGLERRWAVTTFNRGRGWRHPHAELVVGDRLQADTLAPLGERSWDLVVDTWSGAPRAVRDSVRVLEPRAARYVYVSSGSVYAPPPPVGGDESAPTVAAAPDADRCEYPACKRGGELAVLEAFGTDRALLARAGLVLGPHEDVGRLPWWLLRMASGGDVLAPGPPDLPLQFIDARDLAAFVLDAVAAGRGGAFNVAARPGHTTMGDLLETCRALAGSADAQLVWADPAPILALGVEPWVELPIWLPPESAFIGVHRADVGRAHAAGLRCRPAADTVADTWAWLRSLDGPPPLRADLPPPGLAPDRERAVLSALAGDR